MTDTSTVLFEQLRREYLADAPARMGELRKDLAALKAGEADAADSLRTRFHRLAGSGGSYGFPAISTASREAEKWISANPTPDGGGHSWLEEAVVRVGAAFDDAARQLGPAGAPISFRAFGWRAHLVGGPEHHINRLAAMLRDAGYTVVAGPAEQDPAALPASTRPDLAIIVSRAGEDSAPVVARWAAAGPARPRAVLLLADPAGVDLLQGPWDQLDGVFAEQQIEGELDAWTHALIHAAGVPPAVLLVVPDDTTRAEIAGYLDEAGLPAECCNSAREAREALRREAPDLVLTAWELPDTAEGALVRLIRRDPRHALIPVVVFTKKPTGDLRERILDAGADEVIAPPTDQAKLVSVVLRRANRARRIVEVIHHDPLTRLLTPAVLAGELTSLIAHARRAGEELALVLFDLDHFRRINEQLGYAAGDQVLVHVAVTLRGQMRASDVLVRLGGEEFGAVFRRCHVEDARRVAEKMREALTAQPPMVDGVAMPVRVSAGVSGYPEHATTARGLVHAAERALRVAKETGRDRVEVLTPA